MVVLIVRIYQIFYQLYNETLSFICCNLADLLEPLEKYIKRWDGLVKLYRTNAHLGLIAARTLGAEKATGDVIIVLDAHCECVCLKHPTIKTKNYLMIISFSVIIRL